MCATIAQGRVSPLPEPDLQQRLGTGRHAQLAAPRARPGDELGLVGVRGDRDRAGVRDGHRDGAEAHHAAYVEALDHLAHRPGEALPLDVGLGTPQQQERRAAGVAQRAHDEPGRLVVGVVVADERHRWAAGAVVVQRVDVEGRHDPALPQALEVLGCQLGGLAGVEETGEHDHEGELRGVVEDLAGRHRRCAPGARALTCPPA